MGDHARVPVHSPATREVPANRPGKQPFSVLDFDLGLTVNGADCRPAFSIPVATGPQLSWESVVRNDEVGGSIPFGFHHASPFGLRCPASPRRRRAISIVWPAYSLVNLGGLPRNSPRPRCGNVALQRDLAFHGWRRWWLRRVWNGTPSKLALRSPRLRSARRNRRDRAHR